jgi:thioredoxin-dependent peroxiredoxin
VSTVAPRVGDPAPDFSLPSDSGELVTLSSLRGRWVVLYFYPRDNTPNCTTQSCEFRDWFPQFDSARAAILGISADSVQSHARFRKKYALPFRLLADTETSVSRAYGVWKPKSLFGVTYQGIERTTFVVDPEGRIAEVFPRVKVRGHAEAVLRAITGR